MYNLGVLWPKDIIRGFSEGWLTLADCLEVDLNSWFDQDSAWLFSKQLIKESYRRLGDTAIIIELDIGLADETITTLTLDIGA